MSGDPSERISQWAKVLKRRPIRVAGEGDAQRFARELEERLDALLGVHGCSPTHEGWRTLAVRLALEHEKAFKTNLPPPEKRKGAPAKPDRYIWRHQVMKTARRSAGLKQDPATGEWPPIPRGALQDAAKTVHRELQAAAHAAKRRGEKPLHVPSVGTLANLPSKPVPFPEVWDKVDAVMIEYAALEAAERLEARRDCKPHD